MIFGGNYRVADADVAKLIRKTAFAIGNMGFVTRCGKSVTRSESLI